MSEVNLKGKIHITGRIKALTGLAIGGSGGALEIGGVDQPIIRNPLTNEPYIPGSSLKGKLRSLLEKFLEKELNNVVVRNPEIRIHKCETEIDHANCSVCNIFGSSEKEINRPTRLIVRDSFLTDGEEYTKKALEEKGDLPFSEIKTETVIDRVTAQAMPRDLERVPAGAEFHLDLIFDLYNEKDIEFLSDLFKALKLLEDDYLGGSGTRGSGQVQFKDVKISLKEDKYYNTGTYKEEYKNLNKDSISVEAILNNLEGIKEKIKQII
ncbi:CRISPR system Cms endoribonuclease Csm3 [subsurface metagenome]